MWFISLLETRFNKIVNLEAFIFVSLLCFVLIYDCRVVIIHVRLVLDEGLANLYAIVHVGYVYVGNWCYVALCGAHKTHLNVSFFKSQVDFWL